MMLDDADLDAMIDSGVAIVGIEMRPEWRASVRLHLTISLGHAATVLATTVPDHVDPAPVFQA
jgi:hypothetical protein